MVNETQSNAGDLEFILQQLNSAKADESLNSLANSQIDKTGGNVQRVVSGVVEDLPFIGKPIMLAGGDQAIGQLVTSVTDYTKDMAGSKEAQSLFGKADNIWDNLSQILASFIHSFFPSDSITAGTAMATQDMPVLKGNLSNYGEAIGLDTEQMDAIAEATFEIAEDGMLDWGAYTTDLTSDLMTKGMNALNDSDVNPDLGKINNLTAEMHDKSMQMFFDVYDKKGIPQDQAAIMARDAANNYTGMALTEENGKAVYKPIIDADGNAIGLNGYLTQRYADASDNNQIDSPAKITMIAPASIIAYAQAETQDVSEGVSPLEALRAKAKAMGFETPIEGGEEITADDVANQDIPNKSQKNEAGINPLS